LCVKILLILKSRSIPLAPTLTGVQTFVDEGGLGKFYRLFGGETEKIIEEINKELVA